MNLCTSTLFGYDFDSVLEIASESGCKGIELRVADNCHKSLEELTLAGSYIKNTILKSGLNPAVLNSYISIEDEYSVSKLLHAAVTMEVPQVRVVLPLAANAAVRMQARIKEGIPSYESKLKPRELINQLKLTIGHLEGRARSAGVKVLLELHWGTVMSSFTSAYLLLKEFDSDYIGITFDPANMEVEGKEDWEYGLSLISDYVSNVHVKNVSWKKTEEGWIWEWSGLKEGMLDWSNLVLLLNKVGYKGDYAIEDFCMPGNNKPEAKKYISQFQKDFEEINRGISELSMFNGNKYSELISCV